MSTKNGNRDSDAFNARAVVLSKRNITTMAELTVIRDQSVDFRLLAP